MIGAVGEHLARRWRLAVPAWVRQPERYTLREPAFLPPSVALREVLIAEAPVAFRARLIFVPAEPLQRARFPRLDLSE